MNTGLIKDYTLLTIMFFVSADSQTKVKQSPRTEQQKGNRATHMVALATSPALTRTKLDNADPARKNVFPTTTCENALSTRHRNSAKVGRWRGSWSCYPSRPHCRFYIKESGKSLDLHICRIHSNKKQGAHVSDHKQVLFITRGPLF